MKTLTLLFLLSLGTAQAQSRDSFRWDDRDGRSPRVEGRYESYQRDDSLHRILRLERDGRAEIVTEVRRGRRDYRGKDDRRDDRWDSREREKYGRLAEEAARGRTVRHTGRWTQRDGRVVLRLDDLNVDARRRSTSELQLVRKGESLIFDRNDDLYGNDRINFRPEGSRNDSPGKGLRYGWVRYEGRVFDIDSIVFTERSRNDRLLIRAGSLRMEFWGQLTRRGETMIFRGSDERGAGEYTLRLRRDEIVSIEGSGTWEGRRIEFHGGPRS